jgi:hypothetical protein
VIAAITDAKARVMLFLARILIAAQNRPYLRRFRKPRAGEAMISG